MRRPLLKQQPILRLSGTQGTERTHTVPSTLTKIILVLLTMILLPSAAWGQDITIAGIEPNGDGKFINGTTSEQISGVLYNSESNTLTLTDAIFAGQIVWSKANATLIIEINGSNEISNTEGSVIKTTIANNTYEVNFMKGSKVEDSKTLILRKGGSGPTIEGFDYDDANQKGIGLYQIKANDGFAITTKAYELQIGINGKMTWVHNLPEYTNIGYKNDIFGEGQYQAVFDDVNKKLTLSNATINSTSSDALISGLDKLTIDLVGSNSITAAGNYYAISGFNSSTYMVGSTGEKFEIEISTSTTTGQLTLTRGSDHGLTNNVNVSYKRVVPTFSSPTGATSLETASVAFIAIKQYNLTVAGVPVTSANCEDILDGNNARKVSFTPANEDNGTPATLTLKDVTIEGRITWRDPEEGELSIKIDGDNAITNSGGALISFEGTSTSQTPPQLSFSKAEGSGTKTLVLQSDEFPISGFDNSSSPTIGAGLKAVSGQTYMGITTKDVYDLWIDGTQVHDIPELPGYKDNILKKTTATVSFDGSQTLTLNNAEIYSSTDAIVTGLSTLNIDLKGNNFITATGGYALSGKEGTGSYTINFTSSSDPVGNLTLKASGYLATTSVDILYDTYTGLVPTIISPSSATNLAGAYDAIIAKGTALGLTVAGVLVTNSNATEIKGDGVAKGKVSYDETHKTLTLNKAEINGPIESSIEELTVYLIGENTINVSSDRPFIYTGFESSSATLTFDSSNSDEGGLTMTSQYIVDVYEVSNEVESDDYSNLWAMTQNSSTGETYIYYNVQYGINVGDYCVSKENKNNITNESSNEVLTYSPEDNILNLPLALSSTSVISHRKELILQVSGSTALKSINFVKDADFYDGTGTLTITGDSDYDGVNSLSLGNNSSGVITGFSSVDLTLPMHVSYTDPYEFTGWTSDVTYATITDETDDDIFTYKFRDGINYVTFYSERDLYLSDAYTPAVITEISGSTVKTQALSYIPKGVPVLLSKTNNTATTATFSKNLLKYAESSENPVTASESKVLYVLYNDQFVKVTPGSKVYYGGYLDLTGVSLPANTRGLSIDGNAGTSAIDAAIFDELNTEGDAWYDLQGRRIAKPTKAGLYIINGKKVVLK